MEYIIISFLVLISLCLITWLSVGAYFFDLTMRRKKLRANDDPHEDDPMFEFKDKMNQGRKWIFDQDKDEVYIKSFDNLKLFAEILPSKEKSKKVVIMMHGFRAQEYHDFCCSAKFFYDWGYNVILPHERAHANSEGKYLTYGVKEKFDCKSWIEFAVTKYGEDCQIVIMGVSMGCATVLATLGLTLPKNVKACIGDCGYTEIKKIFSDTLENRYNIPPKLILPIANLYCKVFAGFSYYGYSVTDAMKKATVPTMFIHGSEDVLIPDSMSKENYEACKAQKKLLIVEGAAHAGSFVKETELCAKEVKEFLAEYIK